MIMMLGWFGRFRPFLMLRWLRRLMRMTMNRAEWQSHTYNGSTEYIQQLFHTFTQNKVRQKKAAENINNLCGAGEIRTLVQTRNQSAFYMFIFAFDCREQARPKPPTWTLSSKTSSAARGVRQTISDIAAPPVRNASEQQHPGDVTSPQLLQGLSFNLLYFD